MTLFEVERKFNWKFQAIELLKLNKGHPPFYPRPVFSLTTFEDIYFDSKNQLCSNGLWLRKRRYRNLDICDKAQRFLPTWEAKHQVKGSDFIRSAYEETQEPTRILEMVKQYVPDCRGPDEDYGLEKLCHIITERQSFVAEDKFTVVLDKTDWGHTVGEVEIMTEDADKGNAEIDAFLARYSWFFGLDRSKPKGKLTAYFEKFPPKL